MTAVRIERVVVHVGSAREGRQVAQRLPEALRASLTGAELRGARTVERLVQGAVREARR